MDKSSAPAAYVLHTRPYRDTSLIVDFFSLQQGKISAVVKGAKRPKSKFRGVLQPFVPLQINCLGRQELKTLSQAEAVGQSLFLQGQALICGLYLNELLTRLLVAQDAHPQLYLYYQYALQELASTTDLEITLRLFEQRLLTEMGHFPDLQNIESDKNYLYTENIGLEVCQLKAASALVKRTFSGQALQAIAQEDYQQPEVKLAAKRFMRLLLAERLGNKPLASRALLQKR